MVKPRSDLIEDLIGFPKQGMLEKEINISAKYAVKMVGEIR
jgi:hypothetical protein